MAENELTKQNELTRQILEQAKQLHPNFHTPDPRTGSMAKDMALAMLLYGGLFRAGGIPKTTFSNARPPTRLGYPANEDLLSSPLGAGMRADVLSSQNPTSAGVRASIPNPGNLNQTKLPSNQNQSVHDMVLEMLNSGQLPPNVVSGGQRAVQPPSTNIVPFIPKEAPPSTGGYPIVTPPNVPPQGSLSNITGYLDRASKRLLDMLRDMNTPPKPPTQE